MESGSDLVAAMTALCKFAVPLSRADAHGRLLHVAVNESPSFFGNTAIDGRLRVATALVLEL